MKCQHWIFASFPSDSGTSKVRGEGIGKYWQVYSKPNTADSHVFFADLVLNKSSSTFLSFILGEKEKSCLYLGTSTPLISNFLPPPSVRMSIVFVAYIMHSTNKSILIDTFILLLPRGIDNKRILRGGRQTISRRGKWKENNLNSLFCFRSFSLAC